MVHPKKCLVYFAKNNQEPVGDLKMNSIIFE